MNLKRQQEILQELEVLIPIARREEARESFKDFIRLYFTGHKLAKSPVFHLEMIRLMALLAQNKSLSPLDKEDRAEHKEEAKEAKDGQSTQINKEGGEGETPWEGGESNMVTPTVISHKITKPVSTFFLEKDNDNHLDTSKRLLFIAPRGFAKSTLCSVFFPLWLALYGKKKDIFVVSATISLAKEMLRKIRAELEANERILSDFGEMKSDKWTEDMLVLGNGTIIRAKGRGFQIRGFRPDIILCDDLEDEETLYSREQREKLEQWFFRTLLPALKPDQGLLYVGTKLHQLALIGKLEDKEEFTSRHFKALTNGVSIWEEYWPTDRLLALRKELGNYAFEAEYQNNPISLADQPIKPEYLDGVKVGGKEEVSCLAIDPAISEKESSDYRAFVLFKRTEEGFKEVFSEKGRWGVDEQVERIIRIYETYHPTRVVIEEIAFQKIFREVLLKRAREKKLYIPVSQAELGKGDNKKPRDKMTRLLGVSHLFEQRLVEVVNPELRDELLIFPQGDHDDLVDAAVYALDWLTHYRQGKYMVKVAEEKFVEGRKSYFVKEIRPGVFISTEEVPTIEKQLAKSKNFFSYNG